MARRKRWEELGVENGVGEIRFLKWRYFIDYVHQEMLDFDHYIWRGQKNYEWPLQTTLDRLIEKAKIDKTSKKKFIERHLEHFQYAVRGRRGSNPPAIDSENEWWALGQHHGLATPLLDWTTSPFVAAYFAFISTEKPQSKYRSIFAINKPVTGSGLQVLKFNQTTQ
jgi:hypothetical protein